MRRIGLLPRLIIGLVSGIIIGYLCSVAGVEWPVRLLATFNALFGAFLIYIIPFIILGYVAYGIADLQKDAGKLLLMTVIIAYASTVIAGLFAFGAATVLLPGMAGDRGAENPEHALLTAFFTVEMPPLMGVMTALITAFVLGVGMAAIRSQTMLSFMKEFEAIISKVIHNIIIPLLPIHIGGIFANMTFSGQVWNTMVVFGQVLAVIIGMHVIYIVAQFVVASGIAGRNPAGGKDPDFDHAGGGGKRQGMTGCARSNNPGGQPRSVDAGARPELRLRARPGKVRELQRKLWAAAKQSTERRFHALYEPIFPRDGLGGGWKRVRTNRGAAGVDRQTLADVEAYGVDRVLRELRRDLETGAYRPAPVRRVDIDKPHGGVRSLGIPTVRDRVVQACDEDGIRAFVPSRAMCTDNAAMIAAAGWWRLRADGPSPLDTGATPNLALPLAR